MFIVIYCIVQFYSSHSQLFHLQCKSLLPSAFARHWKQR